MLEQIKKKIFETYKATDSYGLFVSAFDDGGRLLVSQGVVHTDKPLEQTLDTLYHGVLEAHQNAKVIVCDVVKDVHQEKDPNVLLQLSPKQYGVLVTTLDESYSGTMLPGVEGVADIQHVLFLLKKKHPQLDGNVNIYPFTTDRISLQV